MMKFIFKFMLIVTVAFSIILSACSAPVETTIIVPSGDTPTSFSQVVEEITPSVVYIYAQDTFSSGSGSGVIMDEEGYILTNRHVVEDATTIQVTLQSRKVFNVVGVWMDDLSDLAVVKINSGETLTAASFADYTEIKVGDWAVAVGHPLGLSPSEGGATVTAGIISNLDRSFTIEGIPYYDVIQTDAAINPGNSGGPLVNLEGEVIGINSAGATEAQNIGYAINVSTAQPVFGGLSGPDHEVIRPFLGTGLTDVTPAIANELGLENCSGALITEIMEGYPAQAAGLLVDDVIVSIGEEDIISYASLVRELWKHEVGETISVGICRGGSSLAVSVILVERPAS
ncbi:S1C family serine protease [Chloroflexota bacterium]